MEMYCKSSLKWREGLVVWVAQPTFVVCFLSTGVHGGADHPPGQRGPCPPGRCCPAGWGKPQWGGGLWSQGADEPPELPMGAPESGKHGEAEQVLQQSMLLVLTRLTGVNNPFLKAPQTISVIRVKSNNVIMITDVRCFSLSKPWPTNWVQSLSTN